MPTITKQRAESNGAAAPAGSMLARGVPVSQVEFSDYVYALIYGINRIGKTTIACQFEKPLALVTFEPNLVSGGVKSVSKIPGVTHFIVAPSTALGKWPKGLKQQPIEGIAGARQLAQELEDDRHFKTVVIDGATSCQDVSLCEIMDLPELPAQMKVARSKDDRSWGVATSDNYMDRSAQTKEVLRKFLNLRKNVIVTAKERDHNPPKDDKGNVRRDKLTRGLDLGSFIAADLGQATAGWLMDACDCVCRLYMAKEVKTVKNVINKVEIVQEVETGRMTRRLLTQLHPNFAAGIRSADPDRVPEFIEGASPKELHDKLVRVLRGEKI